MKIPFLSGLKVNGKVELNNLVLLQEPTKVLTLDINNNITYSTNIGGGNVDLSNYYNKTQTDNSISNAIAGLINSAPSTLDTLNELAAALGNDPNFATTITNLIATKANSSDVYSKSASDTRYKAIAWLPTWNEVQSRPTNLSQFTNDLGNYGNWINQTQANGWFQPLENQRLSSSNNVVFNQITATNKLNIPSTSSNKYSIYIDENGVGGGTGSTIPIIAYLNDLNDVNINAPVSGNVLMFNGSEWINSTVTSGTFNYNDLINKPNLGSFAYKSTVYGNEITTSRNDSPWDVGISKMLRWKNYGDGHVIFDASQGTSPDGGSVDKNNSDVAWSTDSSFPTLMGWNGSSTYGVRVDSARNADRWGGQLWVDTNNADFFTVITYSVANSGYGYTTVDDFKTKLGLPTSGAYDLQWVTGNGAITTNPITINSATALGLNFQRSSSAVGQIDFSGYNLNISATNNLLLQPNTGNVGINTTNPLSNFHVAGSAQIDTDLTLGFNGQTNRITSREVNQTLVVGGSGDLRFQTYSGGWFDRLVIANNGSAEFKNNVNFATDIGVAGKLYAARTEGDGTSWGGAQLEVQGTNPAVAFHYPGNYGASLHMGASGVLNWNGNGAYFQNFVNTGRIIAGYDSGVAGSVNTSNYFRLSGGGGITWDSHGTSITSTNPSDFHYQANTTSGSMVLRNTSGISGYLHWNNNNEVGFLKSEGSWRMRVTDAGWAFATSFSATDWFRSNGATGWYNETYGGGIYMQDSTWVRVYNGKGLAVDNTVSANNFISYTSEGYQVGNYGIGLQGNYDSYRYQAVFSMGAAYRMAIDGTSLANHYGIAWTHSNIGGQSKPYLEHQALFTMAGETQTAIGNGIWTKGTITIGQSNGDGRGINLYNEATPNNTMPNYGIAFALLGNYGTHGTVTQDWATYFNMVGGTGRGWIFRADGQNRASIDGAGNATFNGRVEAPTVKATNSLQVPAKNTSGANTGNHFSIWVEV